MNEKHPDKILESCYQTAKNIIEKNKVESFLSNNISNQQKEWLDTIIKNSESFKAILAVLTTSFVKKIMDPDQDVRYHQDKLDSGYSGRTLDTKHITPFFKSHFKRLSMSESGWLTRSLEQKHPYTLSYPGAIGGKRTIVKESFLGILNDLEENRTNPKSYLVALFINLIGKLGMSSDSLFYNEFSEETTINSIIEKLILHFFSKYSTHGASKLPVIAIYSIYEILIKELNRYKNKKLKELKSHFQNLILSQIKKRSLI